MEREMDAEFAFYIHEIVRRFEAQGARPLQGADAVAAVRLRRAVFIGVL